MEPISLAVVGGVVLTEGVKFLYEQSGEILRRYRERKDRPADREHPSDLDPLPPVPAGLLSGQALPAVIDFNALGPLESDIRTLRNVLADAAQDIVPVSPGDVEMLAAADGLRRAIEAITRQRITFVGENRPASGPMIESDVRVEDVAGYVSGVRSRIVSSGHIRTSTTAREVLSGGTVVGVELGEVGPPTQV